MEVDKTSNLNEDEDEEWLYGGGAGLNDGKLICIWNLYIFNHF